MIYPGPKNNAYFLARKEVLGGEPILNRTRAVIAKALGGKGVGMASELRLGEGQIIRRYETPLVLPQGSEVEVPPAGELYLLLYYRGVRRELKSRYEVGTVKGKLEQPSIGRSSRHRSKRYRDVTQPIGEELRIIADLYSVELEREGEGVYFDDLLEISNHDSEDPSAGSDRIVALIMQKDQTAYTVASEQASAFDRRLENERVSELPSKSSLYVPIARIPGPGAMTITQHDDILGGIREVFPARLVLDGIFLTDDGRLA